MRRRSLLRLTALSPATQFLAAPPADEGAPAASNVPGAAYPRVHRGRQVTFRVAAPGARKVQIEPAGKDNGLGAGPFDMVRSGEDGWSVTTPPAVPGFHYYWVVVDGFRANDPGSETYFGWNRQTSGVEVPDTVDFYDVKDVPHGEVRARWYFSKVTRQWRRVYVYTPPDYDRSTRARYPVLYLQHGAGESERAWAAQGRVNFILDNLIAAGSAAPMLVVMENGMVAREPSAPPSGRGNEAFAKVVVQDLIPMIDSHYRTRSGREQRAIAGLSMGAGQALEIGLGRMDLFAYAGSFSGRPRVSALASDYNGAFADPAGFNRRMRLLWIGAGKAERAQHEASAAAYKTLRDAGVSAVFFECEFAHEWQTWRYSLRDFAPRLFR